MLFDTHSHLHDAKFDVDRADVMARARAAGVRRILTLGDTLRASRAAIALAEAEPEVLAACGVHPSAARSWDDQSAAELEKLLDHPRVPVLGEIGLDYYWEKDEETHRIQRIAFREQLDMARRRGLPVSIHSRESNADVLAELEAAGGSGIGGVLHCFNGTYEEARRGLDMGFFIGVGGTSTYPKSGDLRDVLRRVGAAHLIVETDAPYLPPQAHRGRRNEPSYVALTAAGLADTLSTPLPELLPILWANSLAAFRLKEPDHAPA